MVRPTPSRARKAEARSAAIKLVFRETRLSDIEALFEVRARTRQNPLSRADLAQLGITPESTAAAFGSGTIVGFVCTCDDRVVGFCSGEFDGGEILVLAVLPDFEGRGIGKQLLSSVVARLQQPGARRVWLAAAADPTVRAHGFYRALGWQPNGERTSNGDEILELYLPSQPRIT
jgi:ribosomal protein S18 acetylase RimI-like enzyme